MEIILFTILFPLLRTFKSFVAVKKWPLPLLYECHIIFLEERNVSNVHVIKVDI